MVSIMIITIIISIVIIIIISPTSNNNPIRARRRGPEALRALLGFFAQALASAEMNFDIALGENYLCIIMSY